MENKQMIHIASEIIVLGGLIYYFNQKNKKLLSHIQDLSRKIEDQEGILQKHEEIIRKMSEFINQQKNTSTPIIEKTKKIPVKEIRTITPKKSEPIKVSFKQNPSPIKNKIVQRVEEISSSEEEEEEEEEEKEEEESDLDAELAEELEELEIEEIEIEKLSLKKKN